MLIPKYNVELVEKDDEHWYRVDGKDTLFPGVTGILNCISKPFLQQWAAKEAGLYMQKIITKIRNAQRNYKNVNRNFMDDKFLDLLVKRAKKQHRFIKEKAAEVG